MNTAIDNKEIGKRIAGYRIRKGFSQTEVASLIGLSRPSFTQIELGNRNITVLELARLAEVLNFSLDEIMSSRKEFPIGILEDPGTKYEQEIRISVPTLNLTKFKNLILYILERCAGKPNVGETVLYKLLYFSDFNYYEMYEEHLSGATYRKLAMGPVPREVDNVLHDMVEKGALQSFSADYFGYHQKRYIPLTYSDKRLFNGAEIAVIDNVINTLSNMSASEISRYSHDDMPWKASKERQDIDYELVFYREPPYSARTYKEECDD